MGVFIYRLLSVKGPQIHVRNIIKLLFLMIYIFIIVCVSAQPYLHIL